MNPYMAGEYGHGGPPAFPMGGQGVMSPEQQQALMQQAAAEQAQMAQMQQAAQMQQQGPPIQSPYAPGMQPGGGQNPPGAMPQGGGGQAGAMPQGGGSQAGGLSEIIGQYFQQQMANEQDLMDSKRRSAALGMMDVGLGRIGNAFSGEPDRPMQFPGSPWGGQMQKAENPGLTQLMSILQGSSQSGWGA